MTTTIEVAPETESRLAAKAREQGLTLADYARRVLELDAVAATNFHAAVTNGQTGLTPRQQAARALRGCLKGLVSSEDLIRERRAEASREMQATAAHWEAGS